MVVAGIVNVAVVEFDLQCVTDCVYRHVEVKGLPSEWMVCIQFHRLFTEFDQRHDLLVSVLILC